MNFSVDEIPRIVEKREKRALTTTNFNKCNNITSNANMAASISKKPTYKKSLPFQISWWISFILLMESFCGELIWKQVPKYDVLVMRAKRLTLVLKSGGKICLVFKLKINYNFVFFLNWMGKNVKKGKISH